MTGGSQTRCRCAGHWMSSCKTLKEHPTSSVNHWPRLERVKRRAIRRVLENHDVKPARKHWVICVQTTAIKIPGWALAKRDERLSVSDHHVWFRGRNNGRAKILERQDRQAGGDP